MTLSPGLAPEVFARLETWRVAADPPQDTALPGLAWPPTPATRLALHPMRRSDGRPAPDLGVRAAWRPYPL